VRYADDFVVGFQHRHEAERFHRELVGRFEKFRLALHPDKTRLVEFGRFAAENRRKRGERKPETSTFLGFTHICGRKFKGSGFLVKRETATKRLRAKLNEVKRELTLRRHEPIPWQGQWLCGVVRGYFNYHAVPGNTAYSRATIFTAFNFLQCLLIELSQECAKIGSAAGTPCGQAVLDDLRDGNASISHTMKEWPTNLVGQNVHGTHHFREFCVIRGLRNQLIHAKLEPLKTNELTQDQLLRRANCDEAAWVFGQVCIMAVAPIGHARSSHSRKPSPKRPWRQGRGLLSFRPSRNARLSTLRQWPSRRRPQKGNLRLHGQIARTLALQSVSGRTNNR